MTDRVRELTSVLAADPRSLAFVELAEALRQRGLAREALTVVRQGLARYPALAAALDLQARILCDLGEDAQAANAWRAALAAEPGHLEARKGLAYLDYRGGNVAGALAALEELARDVPGDASVRLALATAQRAAGAAAEPPREADAQASVVFDVARGAGDGALLIDPNGLRLAGTLERSDGVDAAEPVAAQLAGVSREAERASRLLGLGAWVSAAVEGEQGSMHLVPPTAETLLVVVRERAVPPARVALFAERAARNAREWLQGLG